MEDILLVLFLGSLFATWYFIKNKPNKKYRNISVTLAILSFIFFGIFSSSSKKTDDNTIIRPKVSTVTKTITEKKFSISKDKFDKAVENTVTTLEQEPLYEDSEFILEEKEVTIVVKVNSATTDDYAKEIADTTVRQLVFWLSMSYDEIEQPSFDDFGNLPEFYTIKIGVGSNSDNMMIHKIITQANNNGKI